MFLTVLGFVLAGIVGYGVWWVYIRVALLSANYKYRYTKIPTFGTSPRLPSPSRRARIMMPTVLRRVSLKEDEEAGHVTETSYELYSRRD